MKKTNKEIANNEVVIASVENNANEANASVVENNATPATGAENEEPTTKAKKDPTPLEIIRQQYAADKKGYTKFAMKNPYRETTVMKGNFTMKKSEIKAYPPKTATFTCRKKHHFDIQFAEGVTFYMSPDGFAPTSDVSALDEATKKAVVRFAKNFYTDAVVENIF